MGVRAIDRFTQRQKLSIVVGGSQRLGVAEAEGDMAKALVLTVVTGTQLGKKYTLTGRTNVIGSAPGCEMVLYDRLVEPRHAELRHMIDSWFIVALSSDVSGLSVNGAIVRGQSRLRPGDKVTIGSITYSVAVEELQEHQVGF
jgi:pSer/pThr/pTyr-binding forkhead associated (FHA) protein